MKKRILMSLVLLTMVTVSTVFAQNQEKYKLEIWNITQATYDAVDKMFKDTNPNITIEDEYFLMRSASGTSLRSKEDKLTFEQVRQKLHAVVPGHSGWANLVNDNTALLPQQWVVCAWPGAGTTMILYWVRRTE